MNMQRWAIRTSLVLALGAAFGIASAQTAPAKPAAKPAATKKAPAKKAAAPVEPTVEAASKDQIDAAEKVFYGLYECEFNQSVDIAINPKYPAYVDVKHAKAVYLMKPVVSSTGAVRLEDVRGEALMVQIASKSMLLNTKTGSRIVDACVSQKQKELIEAAKIAKTTETANTNSMLSGPAPATATK